VAYYRRGEQRYEGDERHQEERHHGDLRDGKQHQADDARNGVRWITSTHSGLFGHGASPETTVMTVDLSVKTQIAPIVAPRRQSQPPSDKVITGPPIRFTWEMPLASFDCQHHALSERGDEDARRRIIGVIAVAASTAMAPLFELLTSGSGSPSSSESARKP
jgi:hypothetical protein